jgi:uncharacterized protein YeaO (DUF488 family)
MIRLKRAYERPSPEDGFRVQVERFWPRDLDEEHAKIDLWLKEVAPSEEMHVQFGEDPDPQHRHKFEAYYRRELKDKRNSIKPLGKRCKRAH